MLNVFATPQHRRVTLIFLALSSFAAIATLAIGLDGNLPALLLAFMSATAVVLAFVHPWRRVQEFKYLLYASGLGFAVFVVLHNLFDVGAMAMEGAWPLGAILQGLDVVAFLAAVFVCPPAFLIGLGGVLFMYFRGRRHGGHLKAAV